MLLDLHVHTAASDGSLPADEIVRRASAAGLAALAITDHDSVDGIQSALKAAESTDILVIPGVELSAVHENRDVHILGYFVNHTDATFLETLERLRVARRERASIMVETLAEAGFELSLDEVLLLAEGASVGRSHVARVLVERGHADSMADAFERFIGRGRPYYVPKPVARPASAISTILDAGGLPVLAHPGVTGIDDAIPDLVAAGLVGLEAYHAEHDISQRRRYESLAGQMGLIVTGGSDYHGKASPGAPVGSVEMPDSVLQNLLEAARELRT
ncbi:MAG: PHP domain-containing protein [Coriobacteriia bacterium]|nr:PHP domain-containing protein [Coriobacteriia bacterium]